MPKPASLLVSTATLALIASAALAQSQALSSDTVGASPRTVPAASYSLSLDGDVNLGGFVFKEGYPFLHNDGGFGAANTAVGLDALVSTIQGVPYYFNGRFNTASGANALHGNTNGWANTANGASALETNTTGFRNAAGGTFALTDNDTGYDNTANGYAALRGNTTGNNNTASGAFALRNNTTGSYNVAVGDYAGGYNHTGSSSIWIGSGGYDESNTLRIGNGTGTGAFQQNRAFISGIRGTTTDFANAIAVMVDGLGQLGTVSSSRRVKEDIQDMGEASSGLQRLRPVTFRYKKPFSDGTKPIRYGLIAEEVAEVFPGLVVYDDQGRPETVMYHLLDAMFINEIQKQQRMIEGQGATITRQQVELDRERRRNASQEAELAALRADRDRLDELTARLARLEALERDRDRESPTVVARR